MVGGVTLRSTPQRIAEHIYVKTPHCRTSFSNTVSPCIYKRPIVVDREQISFNAIECEYSVESIKTMIFEVYGIEFQHMLH